MSRKDHTLTYVLGAAGAALVGYALFKPSEAEASYLSPEEQAAQDFLTGGSGSALEVVAPLDQKVVTGYIENKAFPLTVAGVGNGQYLRVDAAYDFVRMMSAAAAQGVRITAGSGFRTWLQQFPLYTAWIASLGLGTRAAAPGKSNHQAGVAIDVAAPRLGAGKSVTYNTPEFNWLTNNAINYNWSWDEGRKANEPWHWRYVG